MKWKWMFFWNTLAFSTIQWMLALWSLVPLPFSKASLNLWMLSVHVLSKPSLEDFEHYLASLWNECNCCSLWFFQTIRFRTGSALKSLSNWGFWEISCWGLRNQLLEICPEKVGLGENITRCWTSPGLSQRLIISVLKCPLSRAVAFKL